MFKKLIGKQYSLRAREKKYFLELAKVIYHECQSNNRTISHLTCNKSYTLKEVMHSILSDVHNREEDIIQKQSFKLYTLLINHDLKIDKTLLETKYCFCISSRQFDEFLIELCALCSGYKLKY